MKKVNSNLVNNKNNNINSIKNKGEPKATNINSIAKPKLNKQQQSRSVMIKSHNFSIYYALDYTCHRQIGNDKSINFCGQCNSCQIVNYLNNLKQWFDRASHITLKTFLIGLVNRINNLKIYKYLSDILKPVTESKDFIYARNKFLPSCEEDHLKATNNRCLENDYIKKQIGDIWNWYSNSNYFIKLNFMLSLLNKCEQALVFVIILQIRSILDSAYTDSIDLIQDDLNEDEFNIKRVRSDDFDAEIICEAYDDDEEQLKKDNKEVENILNEDQSKSKGPKHVDFIRQLPVHLSKSILSRLNKKSLYNCLFVCKYWSNLIKEVHKESFLQKILLDDMMLLKGTSSKGSNPRFANNVDVKVPNLYPGSYEVRMNEAEKEINATFKSECNWTTAYAGFHTRNVIMEERNVFCGSYNVLLLKDKRDPHRITHLNGKNLVAYGSFDKKVRFIDLKSASEKSLTIQGHAGSIKSIYICENKRIVITGSYDTSIRCWSIDNGKCLRIYQGHQQTVNCLTMHEEFDRIISGSSDKTCKVWNLGKKKCWRTFKHSYAVISVAINEDLCVTGGQTGKIKVFHLLSGQLIKTISAHQGPVTNIRFNRWHILSCSTDGYALLFSAQGKHKKCIMAMRHPKEVLCIEFQYLRAITGSADGKVRIWNVLNGDCIRVMRGNSQCDPIQSMSIVDNRILVNTENNVILMEFEIVKYEYGSNREETETSFSSESQQLLQLSKKQKNYPSIRASRMELLTTPNAKLFNDRRTTVLEHSSRPVSGKFLRDAHLIHTVVTKNGQIVIPKNSAGHISESALTKRRSIMQSINAIISNQGSLSIISSRDTESLIPNEKDSNKSDLVTNDRQSRLDDLDLEKHRLSNLTETKEYLRNQLNEIKQSSQGTSHQSSSSEANEEIIRHTNRKDGVESKSCIVTGRLKENLKLLFDTNYKNPIKTKLIRPTSSPSRLDTKTRIKLRAEEITDMKSYLEAAKNLDQISAIQQKKPRQRKSDPSVTPRKHLLLNPIVQLNTQKIVTKVFEAHETDLKTNTKMYPVNVKSKLPNPKIIRPKTVPNGFRTKDFLSLNNLALNLSYLDKESFWNNKQHHQQHQHQDSYALSKIDIIRSKSAAPNKLTVPNPNSLLLLQRPKTNPINKASNFNYNRTPKLSGTTTLEPFEMNKLSSNDNLNLMTYSEVDKLMNTIGNYISIDKGLNKEKEQADLYKKFWLLKSTGQYHGSLLAKPRAVAPEIRE